MGLKIAIELPGDLYDRLEAAAEAEKVDPITLIEHLLQSVEKKKPEVEPAPAIAPLYRIHEHAVDMGIDDLAENLDHYLYGLDKKQRKE